MSKFAALALSRRSLWAIALGILLVIHGLASPQQASAVIQGVYTYPFFDKFNLACGFHCYYDPVYGWHEGVDYEVGTQGVGGERIVSGAAGMAKVCPESPTAGKYIVMDHANGHRTRYLHLSNYAISDGQTVGRGGLIGFEGSTGYTDPPGFNHLHFETRHGATTFTCG
jgi:murein DD-endopeptidase MepM/ murein hydrolase activator NlpD